MMNNDSSNNRNNFITQSKSSSYNSKNFSNFKNNYNSNNNNNNNNTNNNNNNNNNNDSNMKHKPVITKESNSRKEVNFNKKTIAAQKKTFTRITVTRSRIIGKNEKERKFK